MSEERRPRSPTPPTPRRRVARLRQRQAPPTASQGGRRHRRPPRAVRAGGRATTRVVPAAPVPQRPTLPKLRTAMPECRACEPGRTQPRLSRARAVRARERCSSAGSPATARIARAPRSSARPAPCSTGRSSRPGWNVTQVYVTNIVRHFRYESRGKRRIRRGPTPSTSPRAAHRSTPSWPSCAPQISSPRCDHGPGLIDRRVRVTRDRGRPLESELALHDGHGASILDPARTGRRGAARCLRRVRRGPRAGRGRAGRSRIGRRHADRPARDRHAQPVCARARPTCSRRRRGDRAQRWRSSSTRRTRRRRRGRLRERQLQGLHRDRDDDRAAGGRRAAGRTSSSRSSRPTASTSCRRPATARSTAPRSTTSCACAAAHADPGRAGHRAVHPLHRPRRLRRNFDIRVVRDAVAHIDSELGRRAADDGTGHGRRRRRRRAVAVAVAIPVTRSRGPGALGGLHLGPLVELQLALGPRRGRIRAAGSARARRSARRRRGSPGS